MTDEAMSPLRRRMIEDMTCKLAPKTQHDYVQRVKNFAAFLGRSPDTASFEDVRRYQLHLAASGVGVPTINQTVSTLRFFFRVTLKRHEIVEHTHFIHEPRKLPVVLSPEEVARLLDAAPGLKYKAALTVAYGAGLRAAEVVSLKVSDIDSKRMIIRVEQGKGGKDPNVMLSPHLLDLLRIVARCADCVAYTTIAYNSCRNRHCPKCQGATAKDWLADREADLLPVPYYHVVFTLPAAIADIAYRNKAVLYNLLFKVSAETMLTIAADPRHLGARIGITSVLHTWGSALTHHPHVHMIVPGGGISPDGQRWVPCRPGFFLPVRVLSRLFRRLFLENLVAARRAGRLSFFGGDIHLADAQSFAAHLARCARPSGSSTQSGRSAGLRPCWLICRATPTASPSATAAIAFDEQGVTFRWKDYRVAGRDRYKQMTLATDEFIRRFLIHVLPKGLHRIRHYGLFVKSACADNIARARELLAVPKAKSEPDDSKPTCPCCGGRMIIIEVFERGATPRNPPKAPTTIIRVDTS